MIESAIWTNVHNGESVAFNTNEIPFQLFSTEVEWRQESDDKPQEHGAFGGFPYLGVRLFHAEGDILQMEASDYIDVRRSMIKSFMPSARYGNNVVGTLQLRFSGMSETVQALCTLDGWPELPMEALGPARGRYMVNWKSFDPRLYSDSEYSATTGVPGAAYGRTYPRTYPKSYVTPSGVTGDLTIVNSGEIDVFPRFSIVGPSTAPALILLSPGQAMSVEFGNLVIAAGETIDIDFEKRTAKSSSGADVYYTLTKREWWPLDSGSTTFRYTAFSASTPSAATIYWRNAYML